MDTNCPENYWTPLIYLEWWQRSTFFGCICIISTVTLLSNTAVIISIFRTKQTSNIFCRLVLFLSLSDCLLAFIYQTIISIIIFRPRNNCIFLITSQFFIILFLFLSWSIIVATALERMLNISSLQPVGQNVPIERAHFICLACVLLALLADIAFAIFTAYGKFGTFEFIIQIVDIIGLVIVFLSYNTVYRKVSKHIYATVNLRNTDNSGTRTTPVPIYLHSTAKVIKRILTAVCIAYVPYSVLTLCLRNALNTSNLKHNSWINFGRYLTYAFVYFNSIMNAVIFIMGNQKCKGYLKKLCCRKTDKE